MNNIEFYRDYWRKQTSGLLNPSRNYKQEMKELLFFLDDNRKYDCLELGCGNGELFTEAKRLYRNYTGVDFSKAMLKRFKERCPDVSLICADVLKFSTDRKYDLIHSNQLIQYLNINQIYELLKANRDYCVDGGIIVHRQIPDRRLRHLLFTDYMRSGVDRFRWQKIMHPLLYRCYLILKRSLGSYSKFGFWYTTYELLDVCDKLEVKGEIFGSVLYRHRFSLVVRV